MEGTQKFRASMEIITSIQGAISISFVTISWILGMISMGAWNDFHWSMELLLWVHGMISMGTWKYFLGST
jgi:hypothetical protein